MEQLVRDLSQIVAGFVLGIVVGDGQVAALKGQGGRVTKQIDSVSSLLRAVPGSHRKRVSEEVLAAREFVKRFGVGLAVEEDVGLPPGGFGLAEPSVGAGRMRVRDRYVDQKKARFVLGPGHERDGTPFTGIWDRRAPKEPVRRFPPEALRETTDEYVLLLESKLT